MPTLTESVNQVDGWTYRLRPATVRPARLLLMLHGWTGDENSMGLFAANMPEQYVVLLPRGPYPAPGGGYSWRELLPGTWSLPTLDELRPSVMLFPARVGRVVALCGFLPDGSEVRLAALEGKPIFLAHGQTDELIPVERARQAQALLEKAGARVTLCESDGGHKVGKECLKGMVSFFTIG
ncbi:MAG: hypothetical protein HY781_09850 [Chloroflexi bacterium]|nr:hypothetical protein [Chloroflexota bacterium]